MYEHRDINTNDMELTPEMYIFVIIYAIIIGGCCIGGCYYSIKCTKSVQIIPI